MAMLNNFINECSTDIINNLVNEGQHSKEWAKKKVRLTEVNEQINQIEMQINVLVSSKRPYSLISDELDRLSENQNKLNNDRRLIFSELMKLEAKERITK